MKSVCESLEPRAPITVSDASSTRVVRASEETEAFCSHPEIPITNLVCSLGAMIYGIKTKKVAGEVRARERYWSNINDKCDTSSFEI